MKKAVEYSKSYYSGFPVDIIPLLRISISLFLRNYRRVKIGITNKTESRWNEHLREDGDCGERMIVK